MQDELRRPATLTTEARGNVEKQKKSAKVEKKWVNDSNERDRDG